MVNPISFGPSGINSQADFSPLANLGTIYQKAQQDQANKAAFAAFQQTGDPKALLASGDMNLAQLGISAQNHLDALRQQRVENKRSDERLGFERARAGRDENTPDQFAKNPDGSIRDLYAEAKARAAASAVPEGFTRGPDGVLAPMTGGPQDPNYQRRVAEAKRGPDAIFDDETITEMAKQARAGDSSVFTNLGRGTQGPENIKRLRAEIVRQNKDEGVSGSEQALRNAEYFGVKAGQRAVGTKGANIEMAATEFNQVLPIVQEVSKAVSRTNYPDLNKIILAGAQRTGDPNVVKLGSGINTLINLYARAISPSGVATVSDKDHAREILNAAWSNGQFDAATGMMQKEIDASLASPEKVRDEMRRRFLKGQGAAPVGYPAPGGAQPPPDPLGIR